jgi:hypothetical protein
MSRDDGGYSERQLGASGHTSVRGSNRERYYCVPPKPDDSASLFAPIH